MGGVGEEGEGETCLQVFISPSSCTLFSSDGCRNRSHDMEIDQNTVARHNTHWRNAQPEREMQPTLQTPNRHPKTALLFLVCSGNIMHMYTRITVDLTFGPSGKSDEATQKEQSHHTSGNPIIHMYTYMYVLVQYAIDVCVNRVGTVHGTGTHTAVDTLACSSGSVGESVSFTGHRVTQENGNRPLIITTCQRHSRRPTKHIHNNLHVSPHEHSE